MRIAFILPIAFCLLFAEANGQCPYTMTESGSTSTVLDGAYVPETVPTRKVIPYTSLIERDVMWSKRVWREIDLREKINHPLYYPLEATSDRASLWDIIKCNVRSGALTAYNPGALLDDDEFTMAYSPAEFENCMVTIDTVYTDPLDGGPQIPVVTTTEIESYSIKKYRIKEDWFFDKQRSVMDVRIIGIAPMKEVIGEDGEFRGYAPVFWLYFPECRYVFANAKVFNRQNRKAQLTFDDLFWKRMFASYIVKESNVFDRNMNEYNTGVALQLESEKIKDEIFRMESDMWHY